INFLKKDGNPANDEAIYKTYVKLDNVQQQIKHLLPLRLIDENRDARFRFNDYSHNIIDSKNKLSNYLYTNTNNLLSSSANKCDYRKAYDDLNYLDEINPNYMNVRQKME